MRPIIHRKNKLLHIVVGFLISLLFINGAIAQDQNIDIGIFEYDGAFTEFTDLTIKIIPDFDIPEEQAIDGILFTIRWPAEYSDISITNGLEQSSYYLYQVSPQGDPELYEGYYYLTMAATPSSSVGEEITSGEELVLTVYSVEGAADEDCASFEIIENEWTQNNNGGPYLSVGGENSTGIIYEPVVSFGSYGGLATGGGEINLGESTGDLVLQEHQGDVNNWQRSHDGGTWNDISGSSGQQVYSEVPSGIGTWKYRAEVQEGSCQSAFSEPAEVIVSASMTEWTGDMDEDWNNSGNWTAGVPDDGMSAKINGAKSHQPLITGNEVAECDDLIIENGSVTTIASDGKLTVHGNINNSAGSNGLIINSTTNSTGTLIHTTENVQATYNHVLTGNQWHDITPVISGAQGELYMGMYIRKWNEPEGSWSDWLTDPNMTMEKMRGYQVWVDGTDGTVSYQGELYAGEHQYNLTRQGNGQYAGFNLVGNHYVSAINWNSSELTKTYIENTFWTWNGKAGNYATYNGTDGTNGGQKEIASSQAFFLYVKEGSSFGTFGVDNGARIHHDDAIFKDESKDEHGLIALKVSGDSAYDEIVLRFDPGASSSFDSDKDAYKMMGGDDAPQIYTKTADEENLAINYLNMPSENPAIPVFFEEGTSENYTISLRALKNLQGYQEIILEDLVTGKSIDLLETDSLEFNSSMNANKERFILTFKGTGVNNYDVASNVQVYSKQDNLISIVPQQILPATIEVYNLQGQIVDRIMTTREVNKSKIPEINGMYIISIIGENIKVNRKVFINR